MNIGFDTIGNATLICYDGKPILANDPWINGSAYFGSWGYSHEIPPEQMEAILACEYIWFSHGHPDHLNPESIVKFRDKQILLPDHQGDRIKTELVAQGYRIKIMEDRKWYDLSKNIKALCLTNDNQDAILLINVNGRLIVNLNDCDLGPERNYIRKILKSFSTSFALAYSGHGDADMINLYHENGEFIPDIVTRMAEPLGAKLANIADSLGVSYFIPFSAMHRFQRKDSAWANRFAPSADDYGNGYDSPYSEILPMFLRFDCETDKWTALNPAKNIERLCAPEEFGDSWSEALSLDDAKKLHHYIKSFAALPERLDFINFRVGGKDQLIPLAGEKFKRGITFEVPRTSLMTCVEYEIFDDLLIGNFMKTTLHGDWEQKTLTSEFSRFVAKYGDNGKAKTEEELKNYFRAYFMRAPLENLLHSAEVKGKNTLRHLLANNPKLFDGVKSTYRKWVIHR